MLKRRGVLGLLGFGLAVPAIVRTPGLLMPVRPARSLHGLRIFGCAPPHPATFPQLSALTCYPPDLPPATPRTGDMYFDTNQGAAFVYSNAAWHRLTA